MDKLPPEYFGFYDDPAAPMLPDLTDEQIEAIAEAADRFYLSLACG